MGFRRGAKLAIAILGFLLAGFWILAVFPPTRERLERIGLDAAGSGALELFATVEATVHEPGGYAQRGVTRFVSISAHRATKAEAGVAPTGTGVGRGTAYSARVESCDFLGCRITHSSGGPIAHAAFASDIRAEESRLSLVASGCGIEVTWSSLGTNTEAAPRLDPNTGTAGADVALRRPARARGTICSTVFDSAEAEHGRRVAATGDL